LAQTLEDLACRVLPQALRARYQRRRRTWTISDRLLSGSETVREIKAKSTLRIRSYSSTALQNYSKYSYRFFLHATHGLAPREVVVGRHQKDIENRSRLHCRRRSLSTFLGQSPSQSQALTQRL
jgi:hypothetical protein